MHIINISNLRSLTQAITYDTTSKRNLRNAATIPIHSQAQGTLKRRVNRFLQVLSEGQSKVKLWGVQ